jgi:endonuclease YncB( thermonuclease family)
MQRMSVLQVVTQKGTPQMMKILLLLALVAPCSVTAPRATLDTQHQFVVTKISDGDGLVLTPAPASKTFAKSVRVRLSCIDAPELKQELGLESKAYLSYLVPPGTLVVLRGTQMDIYLRRLSEVFALNKTTNQFSINVNQLVVRAGMAFVYCFFLNNDVCDAEQYFALESAARNECVGVWRTAGGLMPRPWNWRRKQRGFGPFADSCPPLPKTQACLNGATEAPTNDEDYAQLTSDNEAEFQDDFDSQVVGGGTTDSPSATSPSSTPPNGSFLQVFVFILIVGALLFVYYNSVLRGLIYLKIKTVISVMYERTRGVAGHVYSRLGGGSGGGGGGAAGAGGDVQLLQQQG